MKKTIMSILVALLILGLAQLASAGAFIVQIDVDDDTVKPGESFSVEVDVENNLSVDMEDIEVEIEIKDIDDGDALDDDGDLDDLDVGDDDNIEFDFDVPYAVDEGDYEIIITITGDAANGTSYTEVINVSVEVEKDKHELVMKQPVVDQETLKCSRITELSVTLWNIGTKDEDVELTVYNTELEISHKQIFELEEGDDEDDVKTTRRIALDLSDADAKSYTIYVKAVYDDGDEQETETVSIKVEDCPTAVVENDEDEVIVVDTTTTTPIATSTPTVTMPAVIKEESFMSKYGAAFLLGLAYIIVIIVGVILVVSLLKKK